MARRGKQKGFASKKQWRWAFATGKSWARRKAHETSGGPRARYHRLPLRKTSRRKTR